MRDAIGNRITQMGASCYIGYVGGTRDLWYCCAPQPCVCGAELLLPTFMSQSDREHNLLFQKTYEASVPFSSTLLSQGNPVLGSVLKNSENP